MNANGKKWIVDAALALGFLLAMELDLTGLVVHEWLSVGVGLLAGYHLLAHWPWVSLVTRRFFGKMSAQARRFYVVDAALFVGFLAIGVTGLAMSTWLNLSLDSYFAWRDVHVVASVATLALVALKVGLHWRWIVAMGPRVSFGPAVASAGSIARPATAGSRFGRRQFASAMAATGSVVLFSGGRALANTVFAPTSAGGVVTESASATATPIAVASRILTGNTTASRAASAPTAISASAARPSATTTPTATAAGAGKPTATSTTSNQQATATQSCVYRCPRGQHCSYPGKCRLYTDANGNRRCDLGECA